MYKPSLSLQIRIFTVSFTIFAMSGKAKLKFISNIPLVTFSRQILYWAVLIAFGKEIAGLRSKIPSVLALPINDVSSSFVSLFHLTISSL